MNNLLQKTIKMTSWNILSGKTIIAGADCYYSEEPGHYVIEIVPFSQNLEKAGIALTDEKGWDDFFDSEEEGSDLPVTERIHSLLKTMVRAYALISHTLETRKRKDVYDPIIEKNGRDLSLVMVTEYEPFVNSDKFHPATYVHDTDEFDIWQFPTDAADETIYQTVYPAVKSVRTRKG